MSAAPVVAPTGTLENAFGCSGVTVFTASNNVRFYRVHDLIRRCGFKKPLEALRRWVPDAELRAVSVGQQQHFSVTRAGLARVLRHICQPTAAQAQADVVTLAEALRIDLDAPPDAPVGEGDAPSEEEEEDDTLGGAPPDDEEDDSDYTPGSDSGEEEEDAGWLDDRTRPRAPSMQLVQLCITQFAYLVRKARRAIWKASRVKPQAGCVDPTRRMLTTEQFWKLLAAAAPPLTLTVPTKLGPVTLPPEGGFLLQFYRVLSGLTEEEHLQRAKNCGRAALEVLFRSLGRKHHGMIMDITLYAIKGGASQAAVEMLAAATGVCVHYTAAKDALRAAGEAHVARLKKEMAELGLDTAIVQKIDNYYKQHGHVPRRARPARPPGCGWRAPARRARRTRPAAGARASAGAP